MIVPLYGVLPVPLIKICLVGSYTIKFIFIPSHCVGGLDGLVKFQDTPSHFPDRFSIALF